MLPLLLAPFAQVQVMIWATLLLTIPAVALAIGFNTLFAATVPMEWRGYIVGRRNAMISLVYVVTSLVSGFILTHTPLEIGYTIVFGIGAVGAVMSTYHLSCLRDIRGTPADEPPRLRQTIGDGAQLGGVKAEQGIGGRASVALRAFTRSGNLLRMEVLRGGFGIVILALFTFHAAQFMPAALFPLRWVDQLHFTDQQIAIGTAVFHTCVLLGSLQFERLTRRFGNHRVTVGGTALLSLYPLMTAFMPNLFWYVITSALGGFAWSMVGGALGNYLLEKVPAGDRPGLPGVVQPGAEWSHPGRRAVWPADGRSVQPAGRTGPGVCIPAGWVALYLVCRIQGSQADCESRGNLGRGGRLVHAGKFK